jgi:hypothetical protein
MLDDIKIQIQKEKSIAKKMPKANGEKQVRDKFVVFRVS